MKSSTPAFCKGLLAYLIGSALLSVPASSQSGPTAVPKDPEPTSEAYIAALCTLAGDWSGKFEQYQEGELVRSAPVEVGFQCQPGNDLLIETNTFVPEQGDAFSTLKVIFPGEKMISESLERATNGGNDHASKMQMSYFYGGIGKIYFFKAVRLTYDDAQNWEAARQSSELVHATDNAPSESRYTHIRNGNEFTMIRELRSERSAESWRLSSKLTLSLEP
ncbi:MAG: hypothetical protein ABJ205_11455 [Erythrobacter sp.]|uniref:hypothetical protein n=1 Tax=Erythrobacter sp. TaxID=1042 RepID=UPI003264C801